MSRRQFTGWDMAGTALGWLACGLVVGAVLL